MVKKSLRVYFSPEIVRPVAVVGLPGPGDVGKLAAKMFVEFGEARLFAEYYSSFFPDYVSVGDDGIARLPRVEFYASDGCQPNLVVATGDVSVAVEEPKAYYSVFDSIVCFLSRLGSETVVALDGSHQIEEQDSLYSVATSRALQERLEKTGAKRVRSRELVGLAGLIVGVCQMRRASAAGVLASTTGMGPDEKAATSLYNFVTKAFQIHRKAEKG